MNYTKHYELLIEKARNRVLDCYVERHHIVPKCLGGNNSKDNIVRLTGREHFVAHLLLIKIYPNEPKLVCAIVKMRGNRAYYNTNSKLYEWIRIKHRNAVLVLLTGVPKSEEHRKNISISGQGKHSLPKSQDHKEKISKSHQGKKREEFSQEWRNNLSTSLSGRTFSDEHKKNLSIAATGKKRKPFSDEHRKKLSEAGKRRFAKVTEND
jgi:hypothetical protein